MSWKKVGGLNKLEKMNNITVNSIVTDTFTVRKQANKFNVGGLDVDGDMNVKGNLNVTELIDASGLDISNNISLLDSLIFDASNQIYYKAHKDENGNYLALNKQRGQATLDISGNSLYTLNVETTLQSQRNILARTSDNNGIMFLVDPSQSSIFLYNSTSTTDSIYDATTPNVNISYTNHDNKLTMKNYDHTQIESTMALSNRNEPMHIFDENTIIYDISTNTYYEKYASNKYGNALTLVSQDNEAITRLNMTTPNKTGSVLFGGASLEDASKGTLIADVISSEDMSQKPPAFMIKDGQKKIEHAKNLSVNTNSVSSDHDLFINGNVLIQNNNLMIMHVSDFNISNFGHNKNNKDHVIYVGSHFDIDDQNQNKYHMLISNDGGDTFQYGSEFISIDQSESFSNIYVLDNSNSIIGTNTQGFLYYSNNGGDSYNNINTLSIENANNGIYVSPLLNVETTTEDISSNVVFQINQTEIKSFAFDFTDGSYNEIKTITPILSQTPIDFKGYNNNLYALYANNIHKYVYDGSNVNMDYDASHNITNGVYKALDVYNENVNMAVGTNIISYTINGTSYVDVSGNYDFIDVFILDENRAILIDGSSNTLFYSVNGFQSFVQINDASLNSSGNAYLLENKTKNKLYMSDENNVLLNVTVQSSLQDEIIKLYIPDILNAKNNSNLDLYGNAVFNNDLIFQNNGSIRTRDSVFDIVNDSAIDTINIGANATNINLGGPNTKLLIIGEFDESVTFRDLTVSNDSSLNNLYVTNDVSFNSNLYVNNDVSFNSNFVVNGTTTTQDVNIKTTLDVSGSTTMTDLILSGTISQF